MFLLMFLLCHFAQPALVLHFDINKTLIASDLAGGKSQDAILNELLAERYSDYWDSALPAPLSYKDYVQDHLVPGSKFDRELKQESQRYLHHFVDYLSESNHPLYTSVVKEYAVAKTILDHSHKGIFPSFFKLLSYLDEKGIRYVVVLRSFGDEVFEIRDQLSPFLKGGISHSGRFKGPNFYLYDAIPIDGPFAFYASLLKMGHTAIRDDWKTWNDHEMRMGFGKLFPIDRSSDKHLSLFFDDNIDMDDPDRSILNPIDIRSGEKLSIQELLESGEAVNVDTLRAILDEDYYIDQVEKALKNHAS